MAGIFFYVVASAQKQQQKNSKIKFPKLTLIYKIPESGNHCPKVLEQLLMRFPCTPPPPRVEWESTE